MGHTRTCLTSTPTGTYFGTSTFGRAMRPSWRTGSESSRPRYSTRPIRRSRSSRGIPPYRARAPRRSALVRNRTETAEMATSVVRKSAPELNSGVVLVEVVTLDVLLPVLATLEGEVVVEAVVLVPDPKA